MFFKKAKKETIHSPCEGNIIPLNEVPDPVFADKILGDGFAILPSGETIFSPVNGKITQLFDTLHAYAITSENGIEILIHIGLNTVELNGNGFTSYVKEGDSIKTGDKIAEVKLDYISDMGYQLYTPVIVTNSDRVSSMDISYGTASAGKEIMQCTLS